MGGRLSPKLPSLQAFLSLWPSISVKDSSLALKSGESSSSHLLHQQVQLLPLSWAPQN